MKHRYTLHKHTYRAAVMAMMLFCCLVLHGALMAQVNTGGSATTANHQKQIVGYITNWDAWKSTNHGVPAAGALTHMNVDYGKYTILNFSFFGVARDGSLHGGDYRNKQIYQQGSVQEPAPLLHGGVFDSWDMHLIFGELEYKWDFSDPAVQAAGFVADGAGWRHTSTGLTGPMPVPLHKAGGAPGVIDMAHQRGVKVMASIGGWSMCKHFPEMAADATKRAKFIADCQRLMALGFDGIDFDWEYPGPFAGMNFTGSQADFANFTTLVQQVRQAIGASKLITAAFSASPAKIQGFNWSALSASMNYFNMMTYDFNGGWSGIAGHNAPLYDYPGAEAANWSWNATYLALTGLGVPAAKINMGAPFYGRGVNTSAAAALNAPTQKTQRTVDPDGPVSTAADYTNWAAFDGTPNYEYIRQVKSSWTEHWDDNAKVPYLTKGNYFLSYDNEQSIGLKAQYVVDKGLAGVIVWTVFGDLEVGGSATAFGPKLTRYSAVKSPLVNKINEVFAQGNTGMPAVSITAPANGTVVAPGSPVVISATASDAGGSIAKVEFLLDGNKVGEDTSSPYSYTIASIAAGTHTLGARAIDNSGNTALASVSITATSNTAPVVTIISPAGGATFTAGSTVTISAQASDNGSITKTEFYQGSTKLGEDTSAPYTFAWASVAAGSYSLTVVATDNESLSTTSSPVAITVSGGGGDCPGVATWDAAAVYLNGAEVQYNGVRYRARWWTQNENPATHSGTSGVWENMGNCGGGQNNTPPTVSLTAPANGQTFASGATVTFTATAADADGTVTKVEFYAGATKVGESATAPYSAAWANVAAGSYSLTAKAYDNSGGSTTTGAISITVTGGDACGSVAPYAENSGYVAGSVVKNGSSRYECKPWPYSGWCNGAAWAYAPGTGTYWQDAWTLTGACAGAVAIQTVALAAQDNVTALAAGDFKVVGYMPSWAGTPGDIQYNKVTHINYAFIRPTTTGGLTAVDNPQKLRDIVSLAHANGVKVGIAIGGWSDLNNTDFQVMAANASYRTAFIDNVVSLINNYQLDGVDIDWEYPVDGQDPANFSTLMAALGSAMHSRGKILTAAVSAQGYYANGVLSSVFSSVDFLNIMVYDGGSGADHSPYSYAVSSLDYWQSRGLPASKTVLGVPFYARPSWKTFRALVAEGANPQQDVFNGDYYNGIATIKQKTNLAFDRSIGGMMIWELSQDATGNNSLLSAMKEVVDLRAGTGTPQSPYGGTVRTIPGRVEAEHYDLGGQGVAYNDLTSGNAGSALRSDNVDIEASTDTGAGHNVGWIQAGEWLEYTVNVATAGAYSLEVRVAAITAGQSFHLELDGANISGTLTVPNTGGWQTWQSVTVTTPALTTGQKVLRIVMNTGDFNINYVNFSASTSNPPPTVAITSPTSGATYTAPASVVINASASDNGSVTKVEFYNGATKLGEDLTSPYTFTWSNVSAGPYSLTAKATDNAGLTAVSGIVNITVNGNTGGCGAPSYVENGGYVAGSQVQNAGGLYQCREWPYSGWCNGAAWAYAPGTGTYWQDAWTFVSTCASALRVAAEQPAEAETVALYPNPGVGDQEQTLTLTFDATPGDVTIQVRSWQGTDVYEGHYSAAPQTLYVALPALPRGIYLVRVHGNGVTTTKRYVVK